MRVAAPFKPPATSHHSHGAQFLQAHAEGLTPALLAAIEAKHSELYEARKGRTAALPSLAAAAELAELRLEAARPLHSTTAAGVLSLALSSAAGAGGPELVATGAVLLTVFVLCTLWPCCRSGTAAGSRASGI